MDEHLRRRILALGGNEVGEAAERLAAILSSNDSDGVELGYGQADLFGLAEAARSLGPLLAGDAQDPVMIISLEDLASLLADPKPASFGETLKKEGFHAYPRKRILVREGRSRCSLTRYSGTS